uniref:C-C motif chemokine n=1 Tax=Neogobius melanostomus TaxID=47308 RepID=A0A8C6URA4_9GOBI
MRWITVLALLVVCLMCLSVAQISYDDCCLKYANTLSRRLQKQAVSFSRQETDGGCNLTAVIFTLKRGRIYCTDPNAKWVKDLIEHIKKKRAKNGRRYYRG